MMLKDIFDRELFLNDILSKIIAELLHPLIAKKIAIVTRDIRMIRYE